MILGKISAVDDIDGLQLIVDGEDEPTTKKYTYIASYVPEAEDRVLIEDIGGSYVIIGKIISDTESSGVARTAQIADKAKNAAHADTATTAESCTGNAATATTAASCSGNAATATTAASCSGNAATATTATNLANSGTQYGQLIYNVSKRYISEIGEYVVTDVTLTGGSRNYLYKS